jgi:hypothetical protein
MTLNREDIHVRSVLEELSRMLQQRTNITMRIGALQTLISGLAYLHGHEVPDADMNLHDLDFQPPAQN